jgi:hypothetical protein
VQLLDLEIFVNIILFFESASDHNFALDEGVRISIDCRRCNFSRCR